MSLYKIQLLTSYHIKYFHPFAKRRYGFKEYQNIEEPTIFYGCYDETDLMRINNHKGMKAIMWGGTDILLPLAKKVMLINNLVHLAQSNYIMRDLKRYNKSGIYVPFAPTVNENNFYPVIKKSGVYIYTNAKNQTMYGSHIYNQLMRNFPNINFFLMSNYASIVEANRRGINTAGIQYVSNNQIANIYQQCFLGLRLTKHDGISATVQELGLMGIPTVCNGNTPSCLNYSGINDIINIINLEMKKIGSIDYDLSMRVKLHLNTCWGILANVFGVFLPLANNISLDNLGKVNIFIIDDNRRENIDIEELIKEKKINNVIIYEYLKNTSSKNQKNRDVKYRKYNTIFVSKMHGFQFIYDYIKLHMDSDKEYIVQNYIKEGGEKILEKEKIK